MAANNFPFRRTTDPFLLPATDVASQTVTSGLFSTNKGITSFVMINAYPIWMRLMGSGIVNPATGVVTGSYAAVAEGKGWLVPPGHFGVYSTQYPGWMSCIAVERPDYPIKDGSGNLLYPNAVLEVSYGGGA